MNKTQLQAFKLQLANERVALLAQLARRCVAEGLTRLEWVVLDWNEPALRFYRSLGARALEAWVPHRVTGDALLQLAADGAD